MTIISIGGDNVLKLTDLLDRYEVLGSVEGTVTLQLYSGSMMGVNGPKFGPSKIGEFSNFRPANNYRLGPGIAKEISGTPLIERYRPPDPSPLPHINLEVMLPNVKKNNKINPVLSNTHIFGDY